MSTNRTKPRGSTDSWAWRATDGSSGAIRVGEGFTVVDTPLTEAPLADVTITTQREDGWTAHVTVGVKGEAVGLTELRFVPPDGWIDGVDAKTMASFRLTQLQKRIVKALPFVLSSVPAWDALPADFTPPRPGRAGHGPTFYALKARQYVDAVKEDERRPVALLVERTVPRTTPAAWRRWLAEAERLKLLAGRPKGTEGRAGGYLTKDAIRILEREGIK